jgi:sporulation protein YlmC with PRC-barrel domain
VSTKLTAEELVDRHIIDDAGRDIGHITDLYVDNDGRPHWLLVDTGLFKGFLSVIPVTDVKVSERGLEVHYDLEKLTGAPNVMGDRPYAEHREGMLFDYYRLTAPESVSAAARKGPEYDLLPPSALCRYSTYVCENKPTEFDTKE